MEYLFIFIGIMLLINFIIDKPFRDTVISLILGLVFLDIFFGDD